MLAKLSALALLLVCTAFGFTSGSAVTVNDLNTFRDIKCSRAAWKTIVEPYLAAQGAALRHPDNPLLQNAYLAALNVSQTWTSSHLNRVGDICNFMQFLECDDSSKCVCGDGPVPYSFEQQEGSSICLATRGSICSSDVNCADGIKCENLYCGGTQALMEESEKAGAGAIFSATVSTLLSIVTAMYFIQ